MFILTVVTVWHRKATLLIHASFLRLTAFNFLTLLRQPGLLFMEH